MSMSTCEVWLSRTAVCVTGQGVWKVRSGLLVVFDSEGGCGLLWRGKRVKRWWGWVCAVEAEVKGSRSWFGEYGAAVACLMVGLKDDGGDLWWWGWLVWWGCLGIVMVVMRAVWWSWWWGVVFSWGVLHANGVIMCLSVWRKKKGYCQGLHYQPNDSRITQTS